MVKRVREVTLVLLLTRARLGPYRLWLDRAVTLVLLRLWLGHAATLVLLRLWLGRGATLVLLRLWLGHAVTLVLLRLWLDRAVTLVETVSAILVQWELPSPARLV